MNGSPGVPPLTPDQVGEIGALVKYGTPLVYHPGAYTSEEIAAAIQIAIWDIEYGVTPPTAALGSPIDALSGGSGRAIADVGPGAPWSEYAGFKVLYTDQTTNNQTLLTAVPEPSTWFMMMLNFAALGFAGCCRTRVRGAAHGA